MAVPDPRFPPLFILSAKYGKTPAKTADVTEKVRALQKQQEGALAFDAKADFNKSFGDPEPGADRKLVLTYQYGDGEVLTDEYDERHAAIEYTAQDKPTDRMIGKLTVTVHRAADLTDVNAITKMDPYFTIKSGAEDFKSKVVPKGHTAPVWDQSFIFNLDGKSDTVHITVYAVGTMSDSVIGTADIAAGVLSGLGADHPQWFTINAVDNFTKKSGTVYISAAFKGRGGPRPVRAVVGVISATPVIVVVPAAGAAPTADNVKSPDRPVPVAAAPVGPLCANSHLLTAYIGHKPVGYHNQFNCDVCGHKKNVGVTVTFWHCDVCKNYDCCADCASKPPAKK